MRCSVAAAVLLVVGCAGTSNGPGAPVEEMTPLGPKKTAGEGEARPAGAVEFESCKAHLDAIADCFFEVVTQIQEEPKQGEPMAAFLGKATWQIAAGHVHDACSPLGLTENSTELLLKDGSEVSVEKRDTSWDEMAGGVTVLHITYRFSSPTCPDSAEANIELHMGGPVE
jgi:hypothetical protein